MKHTFISADPLLLSSWASSFLIRHLPLFHIDRYLDFAEHFYRDSAPFPGHPFPEGHLSPHAKTHDSTLFPCLVLAPVPNPPSLPEGDCPGPVLLFPFFSVAYFQCNDCLLLFVNFLHLSSKETELCPHSAVPSPMPCCDHPKRFFSSPIGILLYPLTHGEL